MKALVHAAAVAAALFVVPAALGQTAEMGNPVALRDIYGKPIGTAANPLVVTGGGSSGGGGSASGSSTTTNYSGTITTANTFQSVISANTVRTACSFINTTTTDTEYVFFGAIAGATIAKSIPLAPGQGTTCQDGSQVSATAPTAGDTFYASESHP